MHATAFVVSRGHVGIVGYPQHHCTCVLCPLVCVGGGEHSGEGVTVQRVRVACVFVMRSVRVDERKLQTFQDLRKKHNSVIFSPVFELVGPHVRVSTFAQSALYQLIQEVVQERFVLRVDVFYSLKTTRTVSLSTFGNAIRKSNLGSQLEATQKSLVGSKNYHGFVKAF